MADHKIGIKRAVEAVESAIDNLWSYFRLVIVLGVVALLAGSAVLYATGILGAYNLVSRFVTHMIHEGRQFDPADTGIVLDTLTLMHNLLLGTLLLIVGLGVYDLFVTKRDPTDTPRDLRPSGLMFGSLDGLKSVLGKIVLMILVINFMKFSVKIPIEEPLHLLYLASGIALIALALKFSLSHNLGSTTPASRKHAVPAAHANGNGNGNGHKPPSPGAASDRMSN